MTTKLSTNVEEFRATMIRIFKLNNNIQSLERKIRIVNGRIEEINRQLLEKHSARLALEFDNSSNAQDREMFQRELFELKQKRFDIDEKTLREVIKQIRCAGGVS